MADENKTSPTLSEPAAQALTKAFEAEADADAPEAAAETPPPRKRRGWLWALLALVLVAGLGLGVTSFQYQNRFLPHTRICGVDVSSLPLTDGKAALAAAAEKVSVLLRDADGTELAVLPLPELVSREALDAAAEESFAAQHRDAGVFSWLNAEASAYAPVLYRELPGSQMLELLRRALYDREPRVHPRDAYIDLTDTGYVLVPEEEGNLVDLRACANVLSGALDGLCDLSAAEIPAEGENLRLLPEITTADRRLQRRCEAMDRYMAAAVTVDFGNGNCYTLTPQDIWSVSDVTWTPTTVRCAPDPVRVNALADALASEYGDDGVYAKFRHVVPTRELIYYRVGDKGWIMDRAALGADIAGALSRGEDATVTPTYDYTWYWDGYYGCGDTFVEISIDNQYLWYFLDGKLLVETPVVTGNLSTGGMDITRRGFFRIYYMVTDVFLTGPTWNDHVDYWMPFDGGIGLHDSSWRDAYGGDIYITDGSHGCINTPLEAIGIIYNNIWDGVPVIVY